MENEYGKIRKQLMKDIADAIRRKTGLENNFTAEQMPSEIDRIVISGFVYEDVNEKYY